MERAPGYRARALTPFEVAVARVVQRIPRGTTLGYGEVALRAGKPRAARLAARALHRLEGIPWWRVARSDGTLAPLVAFEQAQLLRAEGWRGPASSHRKPYRKIQRRRGRGARTSE
ncbi:MAG TPA: MGMT family protein [Myxococcales bacterium]|nr:MGMT family protein [Myxococcales bacterium]